jgi:hypothetical protein
MINTTPRPRTRAVRPMFLVKEKKKSMDHYIDRDPSNYETKFSAQRMDVLQCWAGELHATAKQIVFQPY